jgi:hypothetical protein
LTYKYLWAITFVLVRFKSALFFVETALDAISLYPGITSVKFACDGEVPLTRRKQYLREAKNFFEQGLQTQVTAEDTSPVSSLRLFLSRSEAAKVLHVAVPLYWQPTFFFPLCLVHEHAPAANGYGGVLRGRSTGRRGRV